MTKFLYFLTVLMTSTLLLSPAQANQEASQMAASVIFDNNLTYEGNALYVNGTALAVGQKIWVETAEGVRVVIINSATGIVKIGKTVLSAIAWTIKTAANGAVFLVRSGLKLFKWVVTKSVKGLIHIGKFGIRAIRAIAKGIVKGVEVVGRLVLKAGKFVLIGAAVAVAFPVVLFKEIVEAATEKRRHAF